MKQNGRSYKKPRYRINTYSTQGSYEIFQMTHLEKCYSGYTSVPDLYANNLEELNNKLTKLLDELIAFINKPVNICSHCNGMGITDSESRAIDTKEFFK